MDESLSEIARAEYNTFIKINMQKNQLKTGMLVKTRNGVVYMVIRNFVDSELLPQDILANVQYGGYMPLTKYNNSLVFNENDPEYDIVEVREAHISLLQNNFDARRILWTRPVMSKDTLHFYTTEEILALTKSAFDRGFKYDCGRFDEWAKEHKLIS